MIIPGTEVVKARIDLIVGQGICKGDTLCINESNFVVKTIKGQTHYVQEILEDGELETAWNHYLFLKQFNLT